MTVEDLEFVRDKDQDIWRAYLDIGSYKMMIGWSKFGDNYIITITEDNKPSSDNTGVTAAPCPSPVILISGGELYFLPLLRTTTSVILPSTTIGRICACDPAIRLISGFLL